MLLIGRKSQNRKQIANSSMQIIVANPVLQTIIFALVLGVVFLCTLQRKKGSKLFSVETTNELKGFAMIAIILSHIGYFLSRQNNFLFPLSIYAGVGVDIFLFLSGFGLASSAFKKQLSLKEFYKKRFGKLFVPLWIVLILFLALDYFLLQKTYPLQDTVLNFFGIFPHADIFGDINSPLWYITLTLFYYCLFPFFFSQKKPLLSAIGLYTAGWLVLQFSLPVSVGVLSLYKLHFIAFPLGVLGATLLKKYPNFDQKLPHKNIYRWTAITLLCLFFVYFGIHSPVGKGYVLEQGLSLFLVFVFVSIFLLKKFESKFLALFGMYSYEIYLLHWPLLYRYDFLYTFLPSGPATALYLGVFLVFGFIFAFMFKKMPLYSKKIKINP